MRTVAAVAGGVALLLLAGAVSLTAPDDAEQQAPFVNRIALGQAAHGRDLDVKISGVRLARIVKANDWTGRTSGVWVVVDLRVETVLTDAAIDGDLRVGDDHYAPSPRPGGDALNYDPIDPGLPYIGSLLFELPRRAATGGAGASAVLRVSRPGRADLDSVFELPLDLTQHSIAGSVTLDPPVLARP